MTRPGSGNPAASGPRSPSATTRCSGKQREQGRPRLRLERRAAAGAPAGRGSVRCVPTSKARSAVTRPAACSTRTGCSPAAGKTSIRPCRSANSPASATTCTRRYPISASSSARNSGSTSPPRQVDRRRRSALRRRRPATAPPRDPRRRPRHPRRRCARGPRAGARAGASRAAGPAPAGAPERGGEKAQVPVQPLGLLRRRGRARAAAAPGAAGTAPAPTRQSPGDAAGGREPLERWKTHLTAEDRDVARPSGKQPGSAGSRTYRPCRTDPQLSILSRLWMGVRGKKR